MIDAAVRDEVARLYPGNVSSDFEQIVRYDIIGWILATPTTTRGVDMKEVIKMYWNERLN